MQESKYIQLIHKKLIGEINASEDSILAKWLSESSDHQRIFSELENTWELSNSYEKSFTPDVDSALINLKKRIQKDKSKLSVVPSNSKEKSSKRLYWYAIAASIALVVGIGLWNLNNSTTSNLLLSELKTEEDTRMISLEDGSKVWLNKNSKLSYPEKFDSNQRLVKLEGEAFFDIAKETNRSFIIETNATKIKVLGTSFNVYAAPDKKQTTVLVKTGKVQFENQQNSQSVVLVANEKASYNHETAQFAKQQVQSFNELAWQSKQLNFINAPFDIVISDLEAHYQIKIDWTNSNLKDCRYTSLFNNSQIEDIWEALETTFKLKIQRKNVNSFEFIGGSCK